MTSSRYDEEFRRAAHIAADAVKKIQIMRGKRQVVDEDDINPALIALLQSAFDQKKIQEISWNSKVLRHRKGKAGEEKEFGADLQIVVRFKSPDLNYQKGVFVQAKKCGEGRKLAKVEYRALRGQCKTMMSHTDSAFVLDYGRQVRFGTAQRVPNSSSPAIHEDCQFTPFRFFFSLFNCSSGDPKIDDLKYTDLAAKRGIVLTGTAEQTVDQV